MAPATYTGPAVYNDESKFKKVDFATSTSKRRSEAQAAYTKSADNGWVGDDRALLRRRLAAARQQLEREYYTRKLDDGLYTAGVSAARARSPPGATGAVTVAALHRPAGQDKLEKIATGPRPRRRLRHLHIIAAPLFWLLKWLTAGRQLGLGDHRADDPDQGRLLSAQRRGGALDGAR